MAEVNDSEGIQIGENNTQINHFYGKERDRQRDHSVLARLGLPTNADFTGREGELGAVSAATARKGGQPVVLAIDGMPGVGKTALAAHAARALRSRFPDRQLFIDLHAHTPDQSPMTADAALTALLSAVGMQSGLPEDAEGRGDVWRGWLARHRSVVVLDNAQASAQVAPLIPADGSCVVLVTSRRHLGDLPGRVTRISLQPLPPDEAGLMFSQLSCREAGPPSGVAEICRLAGYLPLAVSLLARLYGSRPSWTFEDLIREARAGMLEVRAEERSVAMAFGLSYFHLSAAAQRFFRRLGGHPGTTITAAAAAELAGTSGEEAARHLDDLYRDGLLIEVGYRRYAMHDLIRQYALDASAKDPEGERRDSLARLARSYYGCVNYAFSLQNQGNLMVDSEFLANWAAESPPGITAVEEAGKATAWFAAEEANLIAAAQAARDAGLPITSRLACSMFYFLEISGHFDEWRLVEQIGADAAVTPADKAKSLRNRGRIALVQALEDHERLRLDPGEGPATSGLLREAASLLEESLRLYRGESDRRGEATVLRELADIYRLEIGPDRPGTVQKAIAAYQASQSVYQELKSENGLASLWLALGITYAHSGEHGEAERWFLESLAFAEATDGKGRALHGRLKAYSLRRLADLRRDQGALADAVEHYERCITAFTVDVDDPIGKARALSYRAQVHTLQRQRGAARDCLLQARALFAGRPLGEHDPEARVVDAWLGQPDLMETS